MSVIKTKIDNKKNNFDIFYNKCKEPYNNRKYLDLKDSNSNAKKKKKIDYFHHKVKDLLDISEVTLKKYINAPYFFTVKHVITLSSFLKVAPVELFKLIVSSLEINYTSDNYITIKIEDNIKVKDVSRVNKDRVPDFSTLYNECKELYNDAYYKENPKLSKKGSDMFQQNILKIMDIGANTLKKYIASPEIFNVGQVVMLSKLIQIESDILFEVIYSTSDSKESVKDYISKASLV